MNPADSNSTNSAGFGQQHEAACFSSEPTNPFSRGAADLITLSGYPDNMNNNNHSVLSIPTQLPNILNLPNVMSQTMHLDPRSSYNFSKQPDLSKCKINYNGKACVREFILQVEELVLARNIDDAYLVRAFTCLLSGHALKWFRTIRSQINSWYELKVALLRRFDNTDFDYQLESELRTRKQKPKETLSDFIIDLMDMNSQLVSPLAETTLINIFRHNMLTHRLVHFIGRPMISMDAEIRLSKEIDAYYVTTSHQQTASYSNFDKTPRKFNPVNVNKDLVCLKCKRTGHSYKECKTIKGTVCFKCNKKDVTTLTCDNCNNNSSNVPKATQSKNE